MTENSNDKMDRSAASKPATGVRKKSTAEQRKAMLEQYRRSGLSAPGFAAQAGINYPTFSTWLRQSRLRHNASREPELKTGNAAPQWVEAVVDAPASTREALRVRWRRNVELELTGSGQVGLAAALLQTLEAGGTLPC